MRSARSRRVAPRLQTGGHLGLAGGHVATPNPILNHKDTKNTKHKEATSVLTLFVALVVSSYVGFRVARPVLTGVVFSVRLEG